MIDHDDGERGDAGTDPRLRPYVRAARAQVADATRVRAEDIHEAWRRARTRRRVGEAVVVLGVAAAASLVFLMRPDAAAPTRGHAARVALEREAVADEESMAGDSAREAVATRRPGPVSDDQFVVDRERAAAPVLDARAHIEVIAGASEPEVIGAREVRLGRGSYVARMEAGAEAPLMLRVGGRSLELSAGRVTVDARGEIAVAVLHVGVAAWVDSHGTRQPLVVDVSATSERREPTALELARAAEQQMGKGEVDEAIASLRRLVQRHPRSAAARTAAFDLGRLLERDGRVDEARCAYATFVERWPTSQLRVDVQRKLDRLGTGPACRGLDPQR